MKHRVLTALPVYNEVTHLRDVIEEVRRYSDDILVVDDGSTDGTAELLAEMQGVMVHRHPENRGYGAALKTAFRAAIDGGYEALVTIDCDGQHQPQLIPAMVDALHLEDEAPFDIVSGSRYLETFAENSTPPADRQRINREITQQLRDCFGLELTDSFCGFKAYRVEALQCLEVTVPGYAMPLEVWVQAVRHDLRIREFPVPLIYLDESRSFGGSLDDAAERMAHYQSVLKQAMETQEVPCGGRA